MDPDLIKAVFVQVVQAQFCRYHHVEVFIFMIVKLC